MTVFHLNGFFFFSSFFFIFLQLDFFFFFPVFVMDGVLRGTSGTCFLGTSSNGNCHTVLFELFNLS